MHDLHTYYADRPPPDHYIPTQYLLWIDVVADIEYYRTPDHCKWMRLYSRPSHGFDRLHREYVKIREIIVG